MEEKLNENQREIDRRDKKCFELETIINQLQEENSQFK